MGGGSDEPFKKSKSKSKKRLSAKQIKEEQENAKREKIERNKALLRVHTLKALKKNSQEKTQV